MNWQTNNINTSRILTPGSFNGIQSVDAPSQLLFVNKKPRLDGLIVGEEPGRGDLRRMQSGRCVKVSNFTQQITADLGGVAPPLTISAWVKCASAPQNTLVMTTGIGGLPVGLRFVSSIPIIYLHSGNFRYFGTGSLTTGVWHHLVAVIPTNTANDAIGYLNGVLATSGTASMSTTFTRTDAWQIGGNGGVAIDTYIFDVQVFPRVLTAGEVQQLYRHGASALPDQPRTAWHKLDDQHPVVTFDSSGNNRHAVLTNVNATVGNFFYEGADVPHSYQNDKGYSLSGGAYYPRNESDKTKDVQGNALQFVGKCPNNARLVNSNCLTMDGTGYLAVAGLTGSETVVSKGGTSTVTIASGRINFTSGTCWDLLLSNGNHYPMAEGAGNKCYDVVNGQHGTLISTDLVACRATKQNVYHYNAAKGFSAVENWVTTSEPDSGASTMPAVAADMEFALKLGVTGMLDCPATATTVYYSWLQPQDARRCYASVVVKMDDGSKPVCATTSSGGDFMFVMWQGFTGGDITYDDLGDGFWRVTQYCASRNAAGTSAIYRYSTHSGKGFRASQLHTYFESGRGYVKTIGSSAPPLNLPAKTASLTVQDSVVSSPAGPYHNLSESKIDLTQGVAHPGSAGLPTALDPLPAPTNPLFRRLLTKSSVNMAADRIVRYPNTIDGDRLIAAQDFTQEKVIT